MKRTNLRTPFPLEDYWMGMAFMIAAGSKSQSRQGAIIVAQNAIVSQGFDSAPKCMRDDEYSRHAEKVALSTWANRNFCGATMYLTHEPCQECFLDIVAAEIKRVVYFKTSIINPSISEIAHQAHIQISEFRGNIGWLRDYMTELKNANVF